jgi:uncharacterized protein YxeA
MPPQSKPKPVSKTVIAIFVGSLICCLLCIVGVFVFSHLNTTIKVADGKVKDSYTKKEFASKKQTYDQEYDIVRYVVDGKEYFGKTAAPKTGSSQYITVFYYEKYPQYPWFKSKTNSAVFFCILLCVTFGIVGGFSLRSLVKKKPDPAGAKVKQRKIKK